MAGFTMQRLPTSAWLVLVGLLLIFLAYRSYVVQFRAFLAPTLVIGKNLKKIVAFGDSLTEGLYDWPNSPQFHPYTTELQRRIDERILSTGSTSKIVVQNQGKSGERLRKTMKARLREVVSLHRPDFIVILAGTNDMLDLDRQSGGSFSIEPEATAILNDLQTLHLYCHYNGIPTAALSIPETAIDERGKNSSVSLLRRLVNREMRDFVSRNKTQWVFVDIAGRTSRKRNKDLWDDGVHFSPRGYDLIGEMIYAEIKNFIDDWLGVKH